MLLKTLLEALLHLLPFAFKKLLSEAFEGVSPGSLTTASLT